MTILGRRAFVAGALGAGAGETLSLSGAFDHRHPPKPNARERLRTSLGTNSAGVIHVGHSTHLLCVGGRRLLTDPWFADPAFGALEHERPPACAPEDLVGLDAVLVSHDHPDHADLSALDRFPDKSRVVVLVATEELSRKLVRLGYENVRVLAPWEGHDLGGAEVHAVPAVHDVPELGFVVSGGSTRIYFAGDTGWHGQFRAIAERFGPSFAILPVDGTRLRGSSQATLNAEEAARAACELGVQGALPSHAEARFTDPFAEHVLTTSSHAGAERFRRALERLAPEAHCHVLEPGARVDV